MGLFINNDKHPDVYKNRDQITETNQIVFKKDHVSELLEKQHIANEILQQSINEMKDHLDKHAKKQAYHLKYFGNKLYEINRVSKKQARAESHVMDWLEKLDEKNTKLQVSFDKDLIVKNDLTESIHNLNHSNQDIVKRLDNLGVANEHISLKVNEQLDLQKQMSQQITEQEDKQVDVEQRLENQEALSEKVIRQIDHFRSILFERTNYLAEKIDTSYSYTTSYFTKIMNGNEHLKTRLINQKQKENQKSSE